MNDGGTSESGTALNLQLGPGISDGRAQRWMGGRTLDARRIAVFIEEPNRTVKVSRLSRTDTDHGGSEYVQHNSAIGGPV